MQHFLKYLQTHRQKVRFSYWFIVILLFIFVVLPIFFFFYLFNENQIKQMVVEEFDSNNYHVQVLGHVSPKFWHGLALDFQDVEVQTKSYAPLFKINNMSCQLSWIDLVFAHYKITRINLNGIDINENNLIKSSNIGNLFNFNQPHNNAFDRLAIVNVYDVNMIGESIPYAISDGSLQIKREGSAADFELGFKDESSGTYVLFRGVLDNLLTPILNFSNLQIMMYDGKDFQVKMSSHASYTIAKQQFKLIDVTGQTVWKNYKSNINIKNMILDKYGLNLKGINVATSYSNYFIQNNLLLSLDSLYLKNYKQLLIDNLQADYQLINGNNKLKILSNLSQIKYTESSDSIVANSCNNTVELSVPNLSANKVQGNLVGNCQYSFKKNLIILNLAGQLNQALLNLKLDIFNQNIPYIVISGTFDNIDLSRVQVSKSKLLPLLYDNSNLPFKWLSLINMSANLKIKNFAFDRINLQNLITKFVINDGTLDVSRLEADVYGGRLIGSGKIQKVGDNAYNLQTKQIIRSVSLQNMFDDLFDVQAISGSANLTTDIKANNVSSYNDIHQNLTGKVILSAVNGAFKGVDLNLFVNPNVMDLTHRKSTAFENLQASFDFDNGISRYGSITFSSKYVIANGAGVIDFDNSKINYGLSIKSALPQNEAKINSVLIPVVVAGDLFNPRVVIKNIHLYTTDIVAPTKVKHVRHGFSHYRLHKNK